MARSIVKLKQKPQASNKNVANWLMVKASELKKTKLCIFYLVFGPISMADKRFP